ncbi:MAG: DUF58 domain-containing protein [Alphaproteobacteria bacterium]|nr:DUF58 domain-containing protein [Alphaproteobacteria bacterium]
MTHKDFNSSVYVSAAGLAALQKRAMMLSLPQSKKQALSGSGATKSPFKTKGMDFSEVRQYQAGDDVRQIDWRVTAKYGKPFTKLYTDERQRQVVFVCDLRSTMKFASQGDFKSVLAAKITTFLAWVTFQKSDTMRTVFILPEALKISPTGRGIEAVKSMISELIEALNPLNVPIDLITLEQSLKRLDAITPKGALVFICSDFHDLTPTAVDFLEPIVKRADISFIHIFDVMEEKMPSVVLPVSDGQTAFIADMRDKKNRKVFADSFTKVQSLVADAVRRYGLGYLPIRTDEDYLDMIARYCEGVAI